MWRRRSNPKKGRASHLPTNILTSKRFGKRVDATAIPPNVGSPHQAAILKNEIYCPYTLLNRGVDCFLYHCIIRIGMP